MITNTRQRTQRGAGKLTHAVWSHCFLGSSDNPWRTDDNHGLKSLLSSGGCSDLLEGVASRHMANSLSTTPASFAVR